MSTRLTSEDACVAYTIAAAEVRRLTAIIKPWDCTECAKSFLVHGMLTTQVDPCISKLFSIKREGHDEEAYQEAVYEAEEALCDRCKQSLQAVRDRKEARRKLSFAKRRVDAVGKRLIKDRKG